MTTTRRAATIAATLASLLALVSLPAAAIDFEFDGRGFGHGIGLSQYGAQAQAKEGRTVEQIVSTYYSGATVAAHPIDFPVRVAVLPDVTGVKLVVRGAGATITYTDPADGDTEKTIAAAENSIWIVTVEVVDGAGRCTFTGPGGPYTGCPTVDPADGGRVETHRPNGDLYSYYRTYGRSSVVRAVADQVGSRWRIDTVVSMPLEEYLYGLSEMPYLWEPAALQAQAIAGRSYAMWRMLQLGDDEQALEDRGCSCHLFDSQIDQVFKGWDREGSDHWNRWQAAVDATAGKIVSAPGQIGTQGGVVQAFYSSSSNGRTESKHELWGGAVYPYLVSVADPWSASAINPYARWTTEIPPTVVAAAVGIDRVDAVEVAGRSTSGAATEVIFRGQDDGANVAVEKSGSWVRSRLGLRSNTIDQVRRSPFIDDDGHVHENDIAWLAARGITRGCNPPTNDRFCPDVAISRGEMATMLVRALELPTAEPGRFTDTAGNVHAANIDALAAAGITRGCNPPANDRFCPDDKVTRAQMAAFLTRGLPLSPGPAAGFTDTRDDIHRSSIDSLAAAGITRGCNPPTNDRFCPQDFVTRGQLATFLRRALG